MSDKSPLRVIVEYLSLTPRQKPTESEKALYSKCKSMVLDASKSPIFQNFLEEETAKGLQRMHITTTRRISDSQICDTIINIERSLKLNGSGKPPVPNGDVPAEIKLILNKTRLGVDNGIQGQVSGTTYFWERNPRFDDTHVPEDRDH